MARTPRVRQTDVISDFASPRIPAGEGWAALADSAAAISGFLMPAAKQAAATEGAQATYRDENGVLRVDLRSPLGGEVAAAHNNAATAAYLGQIETDIRADLSELATQHEFDPGGFREAAKAELDVLTQGAPPSLRPVVRRKVDAEAGHVFNRLYRASIERQRDAADKNSLAARKAAAEDAVSLFQMNGDSPEFREKFDEVMQITRFRANSPWIGETEAEGEAFIDAVMGDAKAASLRKTLEDISGARSVSDEQRAELEAAVQDLDLSHQARDQIYGLLNGTLRTIDARQIIDDMTAGDFWSRLAFVESGGDPAAIPTDPETGEPRSSASGRFQITNPTFVRAVKQLRSQGRAKWAHGLSDGEILEHKADPGKEKKAAEQIRTSNREALEANGIPTNDGTEYLAWFLGSGDAVKVLKAAPNTPVAELVDPDSIEANPGVLGGRTAGQVVRWARGKMRVKSSDVVEMNRRLAAIEDQEVRGKAASLLNEWYGRQRQAEAEAAEEYRLRIASGDDVTSNEILGDPRLDDNDQATLLNSLASRDSASIEIQNTLAKLGNTNARFDPYNSSERNAVDDAYTAMIGDADPLDNIPAVTAAQIANRTGYLPESSFNAVRGALLSQDPERLAGAMDFAEQVQSKVPSAFNVYGGSGEVRKAVAEFRHHARLGRTSQEAAEHMVAARDPEQMMQRKNRGTEAERLAGDMTEQDVLTEFDSSIWSDPSLAPRQASVDRMMSLFRQEFEREFIATGDEDVAKARALEGLKRTYGVSNLTGDSRLMRLPPENFYPPVDGSHDWLAEQLENDVNSWVFGEMAGLGGEDTSGFIATAIPREMRPEQLSPTVSMEDVFLVADDETQMDVNAGRPPSYRVFYDRDGERQEIGQRWHGDPRHAMQLRGEEAQQAIEEERQAPLQRAREAREFLREKMQTMSPREAFELTREKFPDLGLQPMSP